VKIAARRFTLPGQRGLDVSVVMDLMIHDIDMALRLIGSPPIAVNATGTADEAIAKVRFQNGALAEFGAGRRAPRPMRFTSFEWADGGVAHIDYLEKSVHNHSKQALNADFAGLPEAQDSLGANVDAFLAAILDGAPAMAPGREAAAAVAVAEAAEHLIGLRRAGVA
jgi:predicted dehydrogenase